MVSEKALFKKAIIEGLAQKYDLELEDCTETADCSAEHYRIMSEITGLTLLPPSVKRKNMKKAIVALLVAAALLLAGCTAYIYRNEIKNFIEEFFGTYVRVSCGSAEVENDRYIEDYYTLKYVPEGYTFISEKRTSMFAKYMWETDAGEILSFEQLLIDRYFSIVDLEKDAKLLFSNNEISVYYKNSHNKYLYFWCDGDYFLNISSDIQITEEELNKILDGASVIH